MNEIVYKLRHKPTGEFSKGSKSLYLTSPTGKVWQRKQDLTAHMISDGKKYFTGSEWEIVEYELTEIKATEPINFIPEDMTMRVLMGG